MNNLKTNPIGIDAVINEMQVKLYEKLTALWSVELDGYPRCYVLGQEREKTIEHFIGGIDYTGNLIHAEKNKFFFVNDDNYKKIDYLNYSTDLQIYFILNLKEIKPLILHRADEEVRNDVMSIIDSFSRLKSEKIIIKDFEKVFDYKKILNKFQSEFIENMQPFHTFRIDCNIIKFSLNEKTC